MFRISLTRNILRIFSPFEFFLFFIFFLFANFLAWKTFWISSDGNMQIGTKVWSDFAATIPLIRSFSFGSNWPPEYPIYAGPPIRYHFIFFALVGYLEKMGVRLDFSLNFLSVLAFTLLLVLIYLVGRIIFKSKAVGILSVVFFLFNGSLSFLNFFNKHPLSLNTLSDILSNTSFSSFGPYDGGLISAFWSLNIYTNQRHLALAYAIYLFCITSLYRWNQNPRNFTLVKASIFGIFIGFSPFIHLATFTITGFTLIIFFLLYPKIRLKILYSGIIAIVLAIPQVIYMGTSKIEVNFLNPGYLIENPNILNFLKYWFFNLGVLSILSITGFFWANKNQRKIAIPFICFFVIGNMFQLSPEIAANHKFFNLFTIGANLFAALFLVKLWVVKYVGKITSFLLFFLMILSGLIDLFPVINDSPFTLKDIRNNETAKFVLNNTSKNSVFLNSTFLYDPASLAGRKIYLGWPYFSWSAGYDTSKRFDLMNQILSSTDKGSACQLLLNENIDYIEIQNPSQLENEGVIINFSFFKSEFKKVFFDTKENIYIYDVSKSCSI